MDLFKYSLMILGILPLLAAVFFGWLYGVLWVVYPWRHAQFKKQAAAWNANNWETGSALEVTVEVTSDTALEAETRQATLICYEKKFASPGSINGKPCLWTKSLSDGPAVLSIPFGPQATMDFQLQHLSGHVLRDHKDWTLPQTGDIHNYRPTVVENNNKFQCAMARSTETTRGKVSLPAIVEIRELPLKEVLTKDRYLALSKQDQDRHSSPKTPSYNWCVVNGVKCWSYRGAVCTPDIDQIVGQPLQ